MKSIKTVAAIMMMASGCLAMSAQSSLPAPGSGSAPGGSSLPAPGSGGMMNPGPAGFGPGFDSGFGPSWGNPWNGPMVVSAPLSSPGWQNQGTEHVVGCGYDAQGVWRVVPMYVAYDYNGVQYDVEVLNAWNPWSDMWDRGVDTQAFNTNYWLRGTEFDFYTVLPWGTFYFNL